MIESLNYQGVPFSFERLSFRVRSVKGIELLNPTEAQLYEALNDTCVSFENWDSDSGFGSSDFTAALHETLDTLIRLTGNYGKFEVGYSPYLSVLKK